MPSPLQVHDQRVMVSWDYGQPCSHQCRYCYNLENPELIKFTSPEEARPAIERVLEQILILGPGCEQELFVNQQRAIEFLRFLAEFGRFVLLPASGANFCP